MAFEQQNELQLFEALEAQPETTQADLAAQVGVAVGTVNWYLKRWTAKGYVKVKRIGRWRWRYLLTPQGMAEKARLASKYLHASMRLYRHTREQARATLGEVVRAGYGQLFIAGENEIADICRLTCLEMGLAVCDAAVPDKPTLRVVGTQLRLEWPSKES